MSMATKNKSQLLRLTTESTVEDVKTFLHEHIESNTEHLEMLARTGQRRTHAYIRIEAQNNVLIYMMHALNPRYGSELFDKL